MDERIYRGKRSRGEAPEGRTQMIRISQMKLAPGHSREDLYEKAAKLLHIKKEQITELIQAEVPEEERLPPLRKGIWWN